MAKRGRPKKSMEDKLLEGNTGNRPIEPDLPETDPSGGSLKIPTRLCEDGKAAFRELMAAFPDWYFTSADKHLVVTYCQVVARQVKAERELRNQAMVLKRGNGARCINPLLTIIQQAELRLQALSDRLGFNREKQMGVSAFDPARTESILCNDQV